MVRETDLFLAEVTGDGVARQRITVAATTGASQALVPRLMADFQREWPDVHFRLLVGAPEEASQMVSDGRADLAVTFSLQVPRRVRLVLEKPAPVQALVRSGHELAEAESVRLRTLVRHPVAVMGPGSTSRQLLEIALEAERVTCDISLECDHAGVLLRFAREAGAVAILSYVSTQDEAERGDLVAVPIQHRVMRQRTIQIQAPTGRRTPDGARRFTEFVAAALDQARI